MYESIDDLYNKSKPNMQTFLPSPNYIRSVRCLDDKRLGKQRVEALQIINILEGRSKGNNHPAILMWVGYIDSLKYYCNCCIDEWVRRGFKNTMQKYDIPFQCKKPWWVGNKDFHRAMRARLIAKDKEYYLPQFPLDEGFNDGKYFWPVMKSKTFRII